ncbi:hypothetical protein SISNIDRAFT_456461 [Sistotremastrum niveocremeum HHB9708]|uniref:Uncharacterized protein n=1 Tax=Sistotremastrum niveocremeum HHB9708 TaxID=1314777 RepID=A0A164SWS6_9AGAM|nr:hypothetical protein SISNIDRAFT_456461 [Sistotremastrum niveocremeum HHB9708]
MTNSHISSHYQAPKIVVSPTEVRYPDGLHETITADVHTRAPPHERRRWTHQMISSSPFPSHQHI